MVGQLSAKLKRNENIVSLDLALFRSAFGPGSPPKVLHIHTLTLFLFLTGPGLKLENVLLHKRQNVAYVRGQERG